MILLLKHLDCMLVNHVFLQAFPITSTFLPFAMESDYCLLVCFLSLLVVCRQKPFNLEQLWLLEDEYKAIVERGCSTVSIRPYVWQFVKK